MGATMPGLSWLQKKDFAQLILQSKSLPEAVETEA